VSFYALIYLTAVSLFAVILTVRDKNAARNNTRRIRERTLLIASIFGGSAAMLLTMLAVRHKTRHIKFMLGIPLIIFFMKKGLIKRRLKLLPNFSIRSWEDFPTWTTLRMMKREKWLILIFLPQQCLQKPMRMLSNRRI